MMPRASARHTPRRGESATASWKQGASERCRAARPRRGELGRTLRADPRLGAGPRLGRSSGHHEFAPSREQRASHAPLVKQALHVAEVAIGGCTPAAAFTARVVNRGAPADCDQLGSPQDSDSNSGDRAFLTPSVETTRGIGCKLPVIPPPDPACQRFAPCRRPHLDLHHPQHGGSRAPRQVSRERF
jgi:hypothetical protein